jgi:hypothetical protein
MLSELAKAEMLDYDSLLRELHKWRSRAEQAEATCDRLEKAGAAYLQRALEAEAALDRLKPFSITVKRLPDETDEELRLRCNTVWKAAQEADND